MANITAYGSGEKYIVDVGDGKIYHIPTNNFAITETSGNTLRISFDPIDVASKKWSGLASEVLDINGVAYGSTNDDVSNGVQMGLGLDDYHKRVVSGQVSGQRVMKALGERESMGTTVSGEDVWRGNELSSTPAALASHTTIPTPLAIGEQMSIISESSADNGATATGTLTVMIDYLDATGAEQSLEVTMNGTTAVDLVPTDVRFINDMYSASVGSGGVAAGNIRIYKTDTPSLVYNMIGAGGNKSLVPIRMVPLGKHLHLMGWSASEAQAKRCAFRIRSTDMNNVLIPGVFCFKGVLYLRASASGEITLGIDIPELSIVKISAWAAVAGSEGSASWWGYLEDS